jgi:D-glycero-alpha-D-manno-heptose 1-phosphate guanylyltransferase
MDNPLKEAIILAGGLSTRLQGVVADMPKPMARVAGKPFLSYLLDYCLVAEIEKIVLAVGYKYEIIERFYGNEYKGIALEYAVEHEPLGTGGAIWNAFQYITTDTALLLNGDSVFFVDVQKFYSHHIQNEADISLALKPMRDFDRYGTVELFQNRIIHFCEKQPAKQGLINAGVYLISKNLIHQYPQEEKFSFEKDILEKLIRQLILTGFVDEGYFIDIGVPEDFYRAQKELEMQINIK